MKEYHVQVPPALENFLVDQTKSQGRSAEEIIVSLVARAERDERIRVSELNDYLAMCQAQIDNGQVVEYDSTEALMKGVKARFYERQSKA